MFEQRDDLLVTVATLYYEENQNQQQIADRLGISRSSISRMIKEARDRGIVEIYIHKPVYRDHKLEQQLIDRFGLRDAYVLQTGAGQSEEDLLTAVGGLAASHIDRVADQLAPGSCIGVAWGTGVHAAVSRLRPNLEKRFNVVQMLGSVGAPNSQVDGPDLARIAAECYGGLHYYLRAPVLVEQPTLRQMLYQEPAVRDGLARLHAAQLAITGVGTVEEQASSFLRTGNLTVADLAGLRAMGIVGETSGRFFDAHGEYASYEINQRIIGISLEDLRQIPHVIAVARGLAKAQAILGALRGRFMNILATDDLTARAVLEHDAMTR